MDKRISQLGATITAGNPDLLPIVQGGITKKITFANFKSSLLNSASLTTDYIPYWDGSNFQDSNFINVPGGATKLINGSYVTSQNEITSLDLGNGFYAGIYSGGGSSYIETRPAYNEFVNAAINRLDSPVVQIISAGSASKLIGHVANKSQIYFGVGGDEFVFTNDGGGFAAAVIVANSTNMQLANVNGEIAFSNVDMFLTHGSEINFNTPLININGETRFTTLTPNTVPYLGSSTELLSSVVTPIELDYVSGASSNLQDQINALVVGLSWKTAVRAATTVAGTLATSFENGDTIDGVVLVTGDRILIKNQASATENGIYTVNLSGAPTRALDMNSGSEFPSATVAVSEGTINQDTQWVCNNDNPVTIGVTNISFVAVGGTTYVGTTNRITVTGNVIDIAATYAGQVSITTLGTVVTGVWNGTNIDVANGGTGLTSSTDTRLFFADGANTFAQNANLAFQKTTTTGTAGVLQLGGNTYSARPGLAADWGGTSFYIVNGLVASATSFHYTTPSATNFFLTASSVLSILNSPAQTDLRVNNVAKLTFTATGASYGNTETETHSYTAKTTGAVTPFKVTTPTSTGQTAGTETTGVDFDLSNTITHASNTIIPTNRDVRFQARTHAFASSGGVITDPATVSISGAPIAGANCTLTNPMALWVQSGLTHLAGGLLVDASVKNNGSGIKHSRVTTGSIAGGSTGLVTITWTTAFADANYTVNASVVEATTSSLSMSIVHIESVTASAVTVRVINNAVGALTGTIHVIAMHD